MRRKCLATPLRQIAHKRQVIRIIDICRPVLDTVCPRGGFNSARSELCPAYQLLRLYRSRHSWHQRRGQSYWDLWRVHSQSARRISRFYLTYEKQCERTCGEIESEADIINVPVWTEFQLNSTGCRVPHWRTASTAELLIGADGAACRVQLHDLQYTALSSTINQR